MRRPQASRAVAFFGPTEDPLEWPPAPRRPPGPGRGRRTTKGRYTSVRAESTQEHRRLLRGGRGGADLYIGMAGSAICWRAAVRRFCLLLVFSRPLGEEGDVAFSSPMASASLPPAHDENVISPTTPQPSVPLLALGASAATGGGGTAAQSIEPAQEAPRAPSIEVHWVNLGKLVDRTIALGRGPSHGADLYRRFAAEAKIFFGAGKVTLFVLPANSLELPEGKFAYEAKDGGKLLAAFAKGRGTLLLWSDYMDTDLIADKVVVAQIGLISYLWNCCGLLLTLLWSFCISLRPMRRCSNAALQER
ncbi:hypothetical protein DFJ74DRAFT_116060 [Hyaloraphidium curvatum]|nr:hypothetical protein DFJ74DRAFT_116060 [Hyaloraphidium curvatum]